MVTKLPFVKGEGLSEVIRLDHGYSVRKSGTCGNLRANVEGAELEVSFEGSLSVLVHKPGVAHYLMSVGGVKEHIRNNVTVEVTGFSLIGLDHFLPPTKKKIFSGNSLERIIEKKIATGKVFDNDYFHYNYGGVGFIGTYGRQIDNLARIWHLPEDTIIILSGLKSGLNGIRFYQPTHFGLSGAMEISRTDGGIGIPLGGKMIDAKVARHEGEFILEAVPGSLQDRRIEPFATLRPPLTVVATYARISGGLSYEQTSQGLSSESRGEGIMRLGSESVDMSAALIIITKELAGAQSQAIAATFRGNPSAVMPVKYEGMLYVHPKILALAQN